MIGDNNREFYKEHPDECELTKTMLSCDIVARPSCDEVANKTFLGWDPIHRSMSRQLLQDNVGSSDIPSTVVALSKWIICTFSLTCNATRCLT